MKFGIQFEFHKIPEWYLEYLDYKELKTLIGKFKGKVKGKQPAPDSRVAGQMKKLKGMYTMTYQQKIAPIDLKSHRSSNASQLRDASPSRPNPPQNINRTIEIDTDRRLTSSFPLTVPEERSEVEDSVVEMNEHDLRETDLIRSQLIA